jgi:hypothetical protein
MIVAVRFPEAAAKRLGGREGLLQLGRQDVLTGSQGRLKSERPIQAGDLAGLELEVLPAGGAIIKARIFATSDRVYELSAYTAMIRVASRDVVKFLDSFRAAADPSTTPDEQ